MKKMTVAALAVLMALGAWAEKLPKYVAPVYKTEGDAASGIDHWVTNNVPDGYTIVTSSSERVTWNAGWYVVTGNVVRLEQGAECKGAVHLVLADGCKLTANGGEDEYYAKGAAICVTGSKNALTIYGQADGTGMLEASGGEDCGAGIGGNNGEEGRNITINGGKVVASGYSNAAGIGGGGSENGSNILINGGEVTASGGSGAAGIGGSNFGRGRNIRINGGIVKAIAGGGWENPLPCGIGSGDGMDVSEDIYVADGLLAKAGTSDPPTDVVAHASPTTDVAERLSGKRYVSIDPALPLPPVASVTIDGVTTLYGDIVSAWDAAKAGTVECPATLKLLKNVTVDTMLAVNIYNSSIVVDLNDKILKGTMANGSVLYNENSVGALSVVDTSVTRTPKYFVRQDDGLWALTNDVTDLSVTGGVLTGGKASGIMCYSPLTLTDVNLVGNSAATGGGGAVYSYAELTAACCTFLGNAAALEGGAVFAHGNYDFSDCRIEGNVAQLAGGGICSYAHGTLAHTSVVGNRSATTGGGVNVKLSSGEGCFTAGTKILMADGSEKNVEEIVEGERVATFDHEGGTNSSAAVCLAYAGEGMLPAVTLSFASGAKLTIVDRHDLLAEATRKYVTLTTENAADFIGTRFYNYRTASWDGLVGVENSGRRTSFHSVYTTRHVNCVANGLLTVADDNDFVLNVYELDEGLKADAGQLAADIAAYGLFDFADYPQTAGYEEFYDSLNMRYLYVAIGKGLVTWDYVWNLGSETVLEPQEPVIEPKLMMAAAMMPLGMYKPTTLPLDPYLAVGSNVVITGNVSAVGIDNVHLDRSGDAVIAILADAADLDIGVTLSSGAGMFGWTNDVNHASAFTSDDANYVVVYTADNALELVPFITVVPSVVEHATAAVYDGETKLVDEPYVVLSNATAVTVIYTAEGDYFFAGGRKVVTNLLDTSKNPAVDIGPAPTVLAPVEYCEPVYVGGIASNGIERWETKACWNYTVVTSEAETVTWGDRESTNWYAVVDADVEIGGAAECFGHVKLILCKGAKLSVTNNEHESGIWTDVEGSFTVYGQPDGAGELITAGSGQSAGIGGDGDDGRNITINGGTIAATGGRYGGAGIGGGTARDGQGLVINGGTVTAVGRRGGTGIGGGAAGGGLKGALMGKRRTLGIGSEITINGGTVTAIGSCGAAAIGGGSGEGGVDMPGLLTFMPAGGAPGVDIAINGGTLYLASPITDNRGEIQCGELIGGGYSSEIESSGIHVSDQAKVFFNLTGCVNHRDEEVASVAAMPTDFAGFVAMTPATQTVDRVLVGGAAFLSSITTVSLTNAATAAADAIAVNAERHLPFASTFLRLTYAEEKLTIKIDSPALTIVQQPEVANGYTIIAETDGNEGITNYAWGVKTERSFGFVALTNENALSWIYGNYDGESAVSISEWSGDYLEFSWNADELPPDGKFIFTCSAELGLSDASCGELNRDGEVYEFTPFDRDCAYQLLLEAEEPFAIENLVYEYVQFDVKAEGENLTAFPPEVGEKNSNYVCRVTYGHNGKFYTGDGDEFAFWGYPITATPTAVAHTTFEVYTNGVLTTETAPGAWAAWSNETAEVVYTAEPGYAFADGTTVKTNEVDTTENPATAPAPDAPIGLVDFTGVTVNGVDIGQRTGDGWTYVPPTDETLGVLTFTDAAETDELMTVGSIADVRVEVDGSLATIVFANFSNDVSSVSNAAALVFNSSATVETEGWNLFRSGDERSAIEVNGVDSFVTVGGEGVLESINGICRTALPGVSDGKSSGEPAYGALAITGGTYNSTIDPEAYALDEGARRAGFSIGGGFWTVKPFCKVTFDPDFPGLAEETARTALNEPMARPSDPKDVSGGMAFAGWKNASTDLTWDFDDPVEGDLLLKGTWREATDTVTAYGGEETAAADFADGLEKAGNGSVIKVTDESPVVVVDKQVIVVPTGTSDLSGLEADESKGLKKVNSAGLAIIGTNMNDMAVVMVDKVTTVESEKPSGASEDNWTIATNLAASASTENGGCVVDQVVLGRVLKQAKECYQDALVTEVNVKVTPTGVSTNENGLTAVLMDVTPVLSVFSYKDGVRSTFAEPTSEFELSGKPMKVSFRVGALPVSPVQINHTLKDGTVDTYFSASDIRSSASGNKTFVYDPVAKTVTFEISSFSPIAILITTDALLNVTVSLDALGGAFEGGATVADAQVVPGVPFTMDAEPVRAGYALAGWTRATASVTKGWQTGAEFLPDGASAEVAAGETFYAKWTPRTEPGLLAIADFDGRGEPITTIAKGAYAMRRDIVTLVTPLYLRTIGDYAFADDTALRSMTITAARDYDDLSPAAVKIGRNAFSGCANLTEVRIAAGVTEIGQSAFQDCANLTCIVFEGDGPVTFGSNAFYRCGYAVEEGAFEVVMSDAFKANNPELVAAFKAWRAPFVPAPEPEAAPTIVVAGSELELALDAGVRVEIPVVVPDDATGTSASGLPSGLKFARKAVVDKTTGETVPANTIYGVPSKATKSGKPAKVKITVRSGAAKTVTIVRISVVALPSDVVGKYAADEPGAGRLKLNVAKTGRISGSWRADGWTWSLSANGFVAVDAEGHHALVKAKHGKTTIYVPFDFANGRATCGLLSGGADKK